MISPTSDFDKVHQLPFAKHEYLKIFVKIIYSRGVNKFCKNYKNNLAKNYKKSIWPLDAQKRASSGRKIKMSTISTLRARIICCWRRLFIVVVVGSSVVVVGAGVVVVCRPLPIFFLFFFPEFFFENTFPPKKWGKLFF